MTTGAYYHNEMPIKLDGDNIGLHARSAVRQRIAEKENGMSDEAAIQRIIHLYTDGCNRQDWPQVMSTFADDGVWDAAGNQIQGHAEIQAAMAGFLTMMDYFTQVASASIIEIAGDTATARTTIRECGKFKGRDEALEVLGYYADDLIRTDTGWKFTRRKFNSYGLHRFALLPGPALG